MSKHGPEKYRLYYEAHKAERVAASRAYYLANRDRLKAEALVRAREFRADPANKETLKARDAKKYIKGKAKISIRAKVYHQSHKGEIAAHQRNRIATDPQFRLACALRTRLVVAVREDSKSGSAVRDLGCTIAELKAHLESKFQPGMTWENWSLHGWYIDHIRPLASFDLTDREQLLQAVHYTNLQPLWATDNIRKSDHYEVADARP